ncbi:MAG: acyltransferase ChoActase/COT/CPT [Piptocephalis tieghemiana]|nr:MAG: acyltransferase ChoActase/COT/CPT [Piptocephalis tieghemiana]
MSTFQFQHSLPRLPIPDLDHTLQALSNSLLAMIHSSSSDHPAQLPEDLKKALLDFAAPGKGQGHILQRRLLDHAYRIHRTDPHSAQNWLDAWWSHAAYLSWRQPIMIHSNYYILLHHDPLVRPLLANPPLNPTPIHGYSYIQILRAATITTGLLNLARSIRRAIVPVEKSRSGPLCMDQYRRIFGVTRRPGLSVDSTVLASDLNGRVSILVLLRNRLFRLSLPTGLPFLPPQGMTEKEEDSCIWSDVYHGLLSIIHLVSHSSPSSTHPISTWTAAHRDDWGKARARLIDLDPINLDSLHEVEDTLLAVALDEQGHHDPPSSPESGVDPAWVRRIYCGQRDRWYDKSISLIVDQMGRAGINGEHSPCDALIPGLASFHASKFIINDALTSPLDPSSLLDPPPPAPSSNPPLVSPSHIKELSFVLDDPLSHDLYHSILPQVVETAKDSDTYLLFFTGYGNYWIKRVAKVSPDAFVQMVLQAAYHHLHGSFAPTYETAATRSFLIGRTEVIRSLTTQAIDFCCLLQSKASGSLADKEDIYNALVKATSNHSSLSRIASQGQGCDRHLFGLSMCLRQGEEVPALLSHPLVKASSHWKLSTSGLFPNAATGLYGTGFGSVVPDGYGMNYILDDSTIRIGIECKTSQTSTFSAKDFAHACIWALQSLQTICEEVNGPQPLPSHL